MQIILIQNNVLLGEMKAAIAKSHPVEMDFLPHENNPEQLHRLQCESNKTIKSEPKKWYPPLPSVLWNFENQYLTSTGLKLLEPLTKKKIFEYVQDIDFFFFRF